MGKLPMENEIKNAAQILGAAGGKAGTGTSKRRSDEHYVRISALGNAAKKFKGNSADRRRAKRAAK